MKMIEIFAKNIRSILAFLIVTLSFSFLFLLVFKEVPKENATIVNISAGIVLAVVTAVVAYYFGTSKDKSDGEKATIRGLLNEREL